MLRRRLRPPTNTRYGHCRAQPESRLLDNRLRGSGGKRSAKQIVAAGVMTTRLRYTAVTFAASNVAGTKSPAGVRREHCVQQAADTAEPAQTTLDPVVLAKHLPRSASRCYFAVQSAHSTRTKFLRIYAW